MAKSTWFKRGSALAFAPALAMVGAPSLALAQQPPSPPSSPASPATAQDNAVETVVVTAQRRGENIQQIPASVTAVSGAELQKSGITSTADIQQVTPGLTFQRSTVATQPTIRGVGSRSSSTGNEPNVAIYLDGVYQAQAFANLFELNDIERIEVLKGPQGTLYGRNATGGAINIVTRRPSFTPTGNFAVSYGTDNYARGSAYVSGPLIADKLAGSLSVVGLRQDGYIHNVFLNKDVGGRDLSSVRGKLLYVVNERAEIGLNFFNSVFSDDANNDWHAADGNTIARALPNTLNLPIEVRAPTGDYETGLYFEPVLKVRSSQYAVDGKYRFDFATLSVVAAYRENNANSNYDTGATVVPVTPVRVIRPHSRGYWVEGNLASNGTGRFTWLAGANFFKDLSEVREQIVGTTPSRYGIYTTAASGFVEGTYKLLDDVFVTGGVRYSHDHKEAYNIQLTTPQRTNSGEKSFDGVTPRAVIRWEPSHRLNFYASYSEGFKSGSFEASSLAGPSQPVNPEKVSAYEIGAKTELTSKFRLNAAIYKYDYTDLQVQSVVIVGNVSTGILSNAARADIKGGELFGEYRATRNLTLRAGLDVLDAKFASYPNAQVVEAKPLVNGLGVGNVNVTEDVTGKRLLRSPPYTANLSADYRRSVPGGELVGTLSLFLSDKFYADANNRVSQPAYQVLNGSLSYRMKNNITLSLQGKNLTDERYATQINLSANGDVLTYERPRQIYAGLAYDF